MKGRWLLALVLVVSLFISGSAVVAAQQEQPPSIQGSPDLDVHSPNPTLNPGETNEVTLLISNDGEVDNGLPQSREIVTTARNVRVEADADDTPLTIESGEMAIGAVTENQPGEATLAVSVPDNVDPGTYSIDVELTYSYTSQYSQRSQVLDDDSRTVTRTIDLEVTDDARFAIVNATTDARVGDTGTLEAEIENTGEETARDINVLLESQSANFLFGENQQDSARIDELEPGERANVTFDVAVQSGASVRSYTLDGTVQFRTPEGYQRVDESPSVGVTPSSEQQFTLEDVESDLYVGEDGAIRGTVTNQGPVEAQNVVVRYTEESPNLVPIEQTVAVGTLETGESASFRLPIEVSDEAEAVPRAIDMAVQYRNDEFEQRLYEDLEVTVDLASDRDQLLVEVQEQEIQAGDQIELDVVVTNNLNQTVTDIEASLFTDSPLDSGTDEAFAESLEPGESTTMTFELEADDGATTKTYPISFDFRYDDQRGNSQLSDTTRVAIDVVDAEDSFPWLLVVGLVVLIFVAAGAYYYTRER